MVPNQRRVFKDQTIFSAPFAKSGFDFMNFYSSLLIFGIIIQETNQKKERLRSVQLMQQNHFEFPENIPSFPLPDTQFLRLNSYPFNRSTFNFEKSPFLHSSNSHNFSYLNFAQSQAPPYFSPFIPPDQPFQIPGFLSHHVPASLQSRFGQKRAYQRQPPDISSEENIKKRLKTEDTQSLSTQQEYIKTEFKQENDFYEQIDKLKQEEQLPEEKDPLKKLVRSPPKNKWKNIPGHIMFAIKRGWKRCQEKPEGPQINSIKQKWDSLSEEAKSKFWTFIQKYNRSWKTWNSIIQFVSQEADQEVTQILLDLISELLSVRHIDSFETWLSQTKISAETKESIKLGKKVFREEFIERIRHAQK